MRKTILLLLGLALIPVLGGGGSLAAQETPPQMVASYDALADTILAVRRAEAGFVRALLDGHRHAAEVLMQRGEYDRAAAEMALFANEGDNAIGGVRKRLLEGGHHFNAEGEEKGVYEPGYVIVTRKAKQEVLELSRSMRQADDDAEREALWSQFSEIAKKLLAD